MKKAEIDRFCVMDGAERALLRKIYETQGLSARSYEKLLKLSRTIADLEGSEKIMKRHLAEAAGLRSLEGKYWGGVYGKS